METALYGAIGLIAVAAVVDVFFLTGVWFSGTFLLLTISGLYLSGSVTFWHIVPTVYICSLLGNYINFWLGKNATHLATIQKALTQPQAQNFSKKLQSLSSRSLFFSMIIARFVGLVRPFYAIILGASGIHTGRFIRNEIIITIAWVAVWSVFVYITANSVASAL